MNKIQRIVFTMACLLTALGGKAYDYKIVAIETSDLSAGSVTAKMGESNIEVNSTVIAYNTQISLVVTCNSGYYLESLSWEEVTDLGWAEAPRRAPEITTSHPIDITTSHPIDILAKANETVPGSDPAKTFAQNHFAGEYTNCFHMPNNNVVVRATFGSLKSFTNESQTKITINLENNNPTETYRGSSYGILIKDTKDENNVITLTKDTDYEITDIKYGSTTSDWTSQGTTHPITLAGVYQVTIKGIGQYQDNKTSGTLTISQKTFTITAKDQSITYGETIATGVAQIQYSGLAAGDQLTSITLTPSTADVTTTGTITPSVAETTYGINNYNVTYNNGNLTIAAKNVNLTTDPKPTITQDGTIYYYNNTIQKPTITVQEGSTNLTEGTDYTIAYRSSYNVTADNIKSDYYYIDITFIRNYTGTKTLNYQIRKELILSPTYIWRTLYETEVSMKVPSGMKAYTFEQINYENNVVILTERSYIKKNVPMMLSRTGDQYNGFYPEIVESNDANLNEITYTETSSFKGISAATTVSSLHSTYSGKEIWILVNDEFVRTTSGTIPANKCFFVLDGNSIPVPMLSIRSNTTGIDVNHISNINLNGIWYTLDGRRLQGVPAKKGIYINNGKKVIIK